MGRVFRDNLRWGVYILCISLFPFTSKGQSLPDQVKISEDGTQLLKGGDISEGFYDETLVRNIYQHGGNMNVILEPIKKKGATSGKKKSKKRK